MAGARCIRCGRGRGAIARARAVGPYDGALRAVVHAFKYDGRRSLAAPLGRLMAARGADVIAGADVVVPVPLHPRRRRARGYNQAADLAARLPLPLVEALRRTRHTPSQTGLPAGRRHRNVRGAFAPARRRPFFNPAARVRGRAVLLVDDVATTGATLDACARVLAAMGAREVRAVTVGRVPSRR